ncbi:MAG: hypothetical protein ACREYE_17655 [Gammaproteobacteria bacterium]
MSETIAVTGKSVKLFKGHYTSLRCRWPTAAAEAFGHQGLRPGFVGFFGLRPCQRRRELCKLRNARDR